MNDKSPMSRMADAGIGFDGSRVEEANDVVITEENDFLGVKIAILLLFVFICGAMLPDEFYELIGATLTK